MEKRMFRVELKVVGQSITFIDYVGAECAAIAISDSINRRIEFMKTYYPNTGMKQEDLKLFNVEDVGEFEATARELSRD